MDLEDCRQIGCEVVWCCTGCFAGKEVTAETAIARYGPRKTLRDLQAEAVCRGCGGGARVFTRGPFRAPASTRPDGNVNFSTPGSRSG